jgi:hypothetical protein
MMFETTKVGGLVRSARSQSVEQFGTPYHSPARRGTARSSTFNLIGNANVCGGTNTVGSPQLASVLFTATIVGGGILSMPYAFARCGLALGLIVLWVTAMLSDFTLYILVRCVRLCAQNWSFSYSRAHPCVLRR